MSKHISIVVPVYNEQDNLCEFYKRLDHVMTNTDYAYNIIFVDDGSTDDSPLLLTDLVKREEHAEVYLLSRNFGHQMALTCGLEHAEGDAVIMMDGDLQHPPELLPVLFKLWEDGYEIVQMVRKDTEDASFFKKITSNTYYRLINLLSKVHVTPGGSDFRLMDRSAVDALKMYGERARFIRGMVNNLGFKIINYEFVAPARFAGESKYNLRKMLHFALDGITAFSNVPLRWAFYLGLILGFCSMLLMGHVLFIKIFTDEAVPGWATLTGSVLFLGGVQLIGIGILGEYIGRIFEEVKQRPLYIIARHLKKR